MSSSRLRPAVRNRPPSPASWLSAGAERQPGGWSRQHSGMLRRPRYVRQRIVYAAFEDAGDIDVCVRLTFGIGLRLVAAAPDGLRPSIVTSRSASVLCVGRRADALTCARVFAASVLPRAWAPRRAGSSVAPRAFASSDENWSARRRPERRAASRLVRHGHATKIPAAFSPRIKRRWKRLRARPLRMS
jgi:hypothetical protein